MPAAARPKWTPTLLELKGWVQSWSDPIQRSSELVVAAELDVLVQDALAVLSSEQLGWLDKTATERMNKGRMLFAKFLHFKF